MINRKLFVDIQLLKDKSSANCIFNGKVLFCNVVINTAWAFDINTMIIHFVKPSLFRNKMNEGIENLQTMQAASYCTAIFTTHSDYY
jgi:hypothetical protein